VSGLDPEPTTRDRYWCAVYLRTLIETAMVGGAGRGVLGLLEKIATEATEKYCEAQIASEELDRMLE
jgi:hypothetical protein